MEDTALGNASAINQVPPVNSNPPTAAPAAPDVSTANPDGSPAAAPAMPVAPGAAPAVAAGTKFGANTGDPNAQHSTIGKIFQAIAGGQTTDYVQTDKGPVPVKRDLKPGEMSRNILASAFSLIAAGAGGALAAKQGRPFHMEGPTIGDIQNAAPEQRKQRADEQFAQTRQHTADVIQNQKYAMEQQEGVAKLQYYADQHAASIESRERGSREKDQSDWDNYIKKAQDYQSIMNMPGAKPLVGPDGKALSFSSASEMAAYAAAHPDVVHGSHDGVSMFGVLPTQNPYTHQFQLIDMPADRNSKGLEYEGAKRDKDGAVMFDKDNNPIPDGTYLDPNTHKPTVISQIVTADQARGIRNQQLTQAETIAKTQDYKAQAALRDKQAQENEDLQTGINLYEQDEIGKMTPKQLSSARTYAHGQQTIMSNRELSAGKAYEKAQAVAAGQGKDDDAVAKDPSVVAAKAEYAEAQSDYNSVSQMADRLAGLTPAKKAANQIAHTSGNNIVADWSNGKVDQQIKSSGLSEDEQEVAKTHLWNSLSANQKTAIQAGNKSVASTGVQKQTPAQAAPADKAYIYDPSGKPFLVAKDLVKQYLASPDHKGWTE